MTKSRKNLIPVIAVVALLIASVVFIAPTLQKNTRAISFGQEFENIDDLAKQLEVSTEIFEAYLTSITSSYEEYVNYLNESQLTPSELTANMKEETGYDFADYIQTLTLISNKTTPDTAIYDKIATGGTTTSETTNLDVFISKQSRQNLKNANITMSATTISNDETIK
jgi:hypothetical protein